MCCQYIFTALNLLCRISPGHCPHPHDFVSVSSPFGLTSAPCLPGIKFLVLVLLPPWPQVTEHPVHWFHGNHFACTKITNIILSYINFGIRPGQALMLQFFVSFTVPRSLQKSRSEFSFSLDDFFASLQDLFLSVCGIGSPSG